MKIVHRLHKGCHQYDS